MSEDRGGAGPLRWTKPEPGRLVGRGHMAGDLLEAWDWVVLASTSILEVKVDRPLGDA